MATDRAKNEKLKAQGKRFDALFKKTENRECFDCTSKQPRWASTNLGIFICLRCAGIHRSLGVHITKVKSTTMDVWEEEMIRCCECIGNERGKSIYEASCNVPKPDGNADTRDVERYIRKKFESKVWYARDSEQRIQALLSDYPPAGTAAGTTPSSSPSSSPAVPTATAVSSQQQQQRGASGSVEWGAFNTSPTTPPASRGAGATPPSTSSTSANGGSQQQAPSPSKISDDFWSGIGSSSASNNNNKAVTNQARSGVATEADFGDFQQSPTTVPTMGTGNSAGGPGMMASQQGAQKSHDSSLMSFGSSKSGGGNTGTPTSQPGHDDILAAFGTGRALGQQPAGGATGFPPPIQGQSGVGAMRHLDVQGQSGVGAVRHMDVQGQGGQPLPPHHHQHSSSGELSHVTMPPHHAHLHFPQHHPGPAHHHQSQSAPTNTAWDPF